MSQAASVAPPDDLHLRPAASLDGQVTIEIWDRSPAAGRRHSRDHWSRDTTPVRDPVVPGNGDEQSPVQRVADVATSPVVAAALSPQENPEPRSPSTKSDKASSAVLDLKAVHFCVEVEGRRSRGVQANPPDFRLRFVPKLKWTCSVSAAVGNVFRVFVSQAGMAVFLLVWTLLGAYAFHATEGPREAGLGLEVRLMQGRLSSSLTDQLRQPNHRAWKTIEEVLQRHEAAVSDAINAGYASGGVVWNFAGSLLFAVNMLTTIGFGAPVPRTLVGQSAALIFSGIAIPLHLVLVVNFGALVAENLQKVLVRRRSSQSDHVSSPTWFLWLPVLVIVSHYLFGIVLFGGVVLFPLLFTTAGGVGQRSSFERTLYALYLECAVIIAGISINVWRISATSGFLSFSLRHNLLARSKD